MFSVRLNVAAMEMLPREGETFWHLAKALKDAADPDHLFSPGRYGL
jgi:FAD/FMN-containing dehydrogenase